MTLIASFLPLVCWLAYGVIVQRVEKRYPSLSIIMSGQRRRWVANAVRRDTPMDAILAGNLMSAVSFFASTTVLLMSALFAVFGQLETVYEALNRFAPGRISITELEIHVIGLLVMFMLAFLSFTLSLRQFNHFCIMLGAADHSERSDPHEVAVIAALNTMGARNFNHGLRAYYFSAGAIAWLFEPLASIAITLIVLAVLVHREFYSTARSLVLRLEKHEPPGGKLS